MSCQGYIEVRSFGGGVRRKLRENSSWGLLLVHFQISSAIFGPERNITEISFCVLFNKFSYMKYKAPATENY